MSLVFCFAWCLETFMRCCDVVVMVVDWLIRSIRSDPLSRKKYGGMVGVLSCLRLQKLPPPCVCVALHHVLSLRNVF